MVIIIQILNGSSRLRREFEPILRAKVFDDPASRIHIEAILRDVRIHGIARNFNDISLGHRIGIGFRRISCYAVCRSRHDQLITLGNGGIGKGIVALLDLEGLSLRKSIGFLRDVRKEGDYIVVRGPSCRGCGKGRIIDVVHLGHRNADGVRIVSGGRRIRVCHGIEALGTVRFQRCDGEEAAGDVHLFFCRFCDLEQALIVAAFHVKSTCFHNKHTVRAFGCSDKIVSGQGNDQLVCCCCFFHSKRIAICNELIVFDRHRFTVAADIDAIVRRDVTILNRYILCSGKLTKAMNACCL